MLIRTIVRSAINALSRLAVPAFIGLSLAQASIYDGKRHSPTTLTCYPYLTGSRPIDQYRDGDFAPSSSSPTLEVNLLTIDSVVLVE